MEYKDYYKILGIEKKADADQIKRAYRKLAMQYHPDRNPENKQAEEKFKEINEAYQVLGDPEKRARFDQLGDSYARYTQRGGAPGGFNWEDWYVRTPGSGNVRVEMGDLDDILGGGFSEFFSRIFGGLGGMPNTGVGASQRAPARPQYEKPVFEQEIEITLQEAFHGTTRRFELDDRRLEVKIPKGARNGTKVRVRAAVSSGVEGQKSDLYLVIKVKNEPNFERKDADLYTDVQINLYTAVLGGEVTVSTLSGKVVLTIPPGTQPGQTFRLVGRGMPLMRDPERSGDLFVRANVKIPRDLTEKQRQLFQQLSSLS
jgi:curved DNA-binding protein